MYNPGYQNIAQQVIADQTAKVFNPQAFHSLYSSVLPTLKDAVGMYKEAFTYTRANQFHIPDGINKAVANEGLGVSDRTLRRWKHDSDTLNDKLAGMSFLSQDKEVSNVKIDYMSTALTSYTSNPLVKDAISHAVTPDYAVLQQIDQRLYDKEISPQQAAKERREHLYELAYDAMRKSVGTAVSQLPAEAQLMAKAVSLGLGDHKNTEAKAEFEREFFRVAAQEHGDDVEHLAEVAGLSPEYARKKLKALGLQRKELAALKKTEKFHLEDFLH
ncbi:hypothetical protein H6504_04740 [Candidatus Woesearchaeota archaeon]|nr:hypothetical protein [Candidatus Woesearchaeota archaeon]